jgi:hypothetical protein
MTKWIPAFVLPDIFVQKPIEGGMAALANFDDVGVQQIFIDIPVLAQFVQKDLSTDLNKKEGDRRPPSRFVDGWVKPGHDDKRITNTPSLSRTYRI